MKSYGKYLGKKAFWYVLTLVVAVALNFFLPRLIPGNPVDVVAANMTQGMQDSDKVKKVYEAFYVQFGMDKPVWQQFFIYVGNLFKGDMGISFSQYPRPVSEIIGAAVPWTLMLQLPAILVAWVLGNILGALAAYLKGVFDKAIFPFFLFLNAIPPFSMALIMVWLLATNWGLFPGSGGYAFDMILNWSNPNFWWSVLEHYHLPFWSLVLVNIGGQSLGMREMSIYELNADYVKYARFMGVKDGKIVGYVFRNAALPQVSGLALSLGTMMGGALITETVFSYPGIGTSLMSAIRNQDFPLISGCTLFITIMVLIANFAVDIVYGLIDPRIRTAQQEEG